MKRLLKLLGFVVMCSLLVVFCCSADVLSECVDPEIYKDADAMKAFEEQIPQEIQDAVKAQDPALNAFGEMTAYFEKDKFGCSIRPEGYAGEYIREDNILVIMVQNPSTFMETEAYRNITDKSVVEIVEVKNDYQELKELRWIANKLYENGYHLVSDGVDIKNNAYLITMLADDFESLMENGYIEKMSSEYPVIFDIEDPVASCVTLRGGSYLQNESTGSSMTLGICGTYMGKKAVLTCGHGNHKSLTTYPYIRNTSNRIGQVVFQRANTFQYEYTDAGLGDFSIIDVTSSDTTSNYVYPSYQITGTYSDVPVGTTIYKYGNASGYSWGTVQQIGMRVSYSTIGDASISVPVTYYVDGLTKSYMTNSTNTNAVSPGDSGGPIWRNSGSSHLLHGIVTAYISASPARVMYSTPIYYATYNGFTVRTN